MVKRLYFDTMGKAKTRSFIKLLTPFAGYESLPTPSQ